MSENDDHKSDEDELQPHAGDASRADRSLSPHQGREHFRHTRMSAAWVSVVVAIIFGVALIDFIAQNTRDVRIDFFSVSGRMPIAVALLVAALSGAIVVVAVGIGRVAQLRLTMRRQRRRHDAEHGVEG
ncbi:MAG TPA: lipopolysaccharide assembly protein LapA domain-containing protein [Acidimicrobiales bacterium]